VECCVLTDVSAFIASSRQELLRMLVYEYIMFSVQEKASRSTVFLVEPSDP
jgi:hypothetical protein